jgi:hypothetical protein
MLQGLPVAEKMVVNRALENLSALASSFGGAIPVSTACSGTDLFVPTVGDLIVKSNSTIAYVSRRLVVCVLQECAKHINEGHVFEQPSDTVFLIL